VNNSSTSIISNEIEPSDPPPEQGAAPETVDVMILPAEFFFVEHIEIPSALEAGELDDFAELTMEGLAPFPLEQLNWGFLCDSENQTLILYAALRDRLKREGYEALEDYTWVLPDFACLLGARFAEPVHVVLKTPGHATYLEFPGGQKLPTVVEVTGAKATKTDLPENDESSYLELRLIQLTVDEKARPTFHFQTVGEPPVEGHWSPLSPDEPALWRADVRPASFKTAERSARRTTALITRLLRYAAVFALILVFMEGLLWAGQFWLGTLESKIDAQATAVRRVEDKQSLTNKLEQVAQNELRPIAILEAANQIRLNLGKTGIVYNETVIEGSNRITIEGTANTINELNNYTNSLNDSGTFTLVGSPRQRTRGGETTFTVTLDYEHPDTDGDSAPEASPSDAPAVADAASETADRNDPIE
jgi:hypothetical protein